MASPVLNAWRRVALAPSQALSLSLSFSSSLASHCLQCPGSFASASSLAGLAQAHSQRRAFASSERPSVFSSFTASRVAATGTRTQRLSEHFVYHKILDKSPASSPAPRLTTPPSPPRAPGPASPLSLRRRLEHSFFLCVLSLRKKSALGRLLWKMCYARASERAAAAQRNASEAEEQGFTSFSQLEAVKKEQKKRLNKLFSLAAACGVLAVSVGGLIYVVATWYEEPLIKIGVKRPAAAEGEDAPDKDTIVA
ncbi:hypothetical protein BESB_011060 [Besnoitia besnoiti]|uniref:Transmembrane protein n=1 Tax=Besnoitia besnoiti TaxID=94643 RepID=A0A2A9MMZ5_BESBE|nr:hypothetical protein BESB_011060 [Besnoitia besnoiti]PFH38764.1 hypothetical protein BESB_011060 [Besnoitia besnoiti]